MNKKAGMLATLVVFAMGKGASAATKAEVFSGSSPCGEGVRAALSIQDAKCELVEWRVTITPTEYTLRAKYGPTQAGRPGLAWNAKSVQRGGALTQRRGIKTNPDAVVYELDGALSFYEVDPNVLQMLSRDRSLMVGDGGYSYTLNRNASSEPQVSRALQRAQPEMSYPISDVATGPKVFGIFEGRSPCQGIARQLKLSVDRGCNKTKWRVTLLQDPKTRSPTTYRIEGSLFPAAPREGTWTALLGTPKDRHAIVYRLTTPNAPPLLLLKGDDNVLFLLDENSNPLVGRADFSYTLNRKT